MQKRGQVTIFILIGLLVVLVVAFLFATSSFDSRLDTEVDAPEHVTAVETYVSSCLEQQLTAVVSLVSMQGGYYYVPPEPYMYTLDSTNYSVYTPYIPYYIYGQENIMPTIEIISHQIAMGMQEQMDYCADFSLYPYDVHLTSWNWEVDILVQDGAVFAEIEFPLRITVDESTSSLETFSVETSSALYDLFTVAQQFTALQDGETSICVTCQIDVLSQYTFTLTTDDLFHGETYDVLYTLRTEDEDAAFSFMHQFIVEESTFDFSFSPIDAQEATIGYSYEYTATTTKQDVTFSDDTALFAIDPTTGLISFTPDKDDVGSWFVTLTATDETGDSVQETYLFEIVDVVSGSLALDPLPYFVAQVDEAFTYTVSAASDTTVYFTDSTDLFAINATTGEIAFTPTTTDVGEHSFTITAIDEEGNALEEEGYMVILE